VHTYLEPRICKPHFRSLLQLLSQHPYKGPENDEDMELLGTEKLLNEVQASEMELHSELHRLLAIKIKGIFRKLL
jgi:hypothetical protein